MEIEGEGEGGGRENGRVEKMTSQNEGAGRRGSAAGRR